MSNAVEQFIRKEIDIVHLFNQLNMRVVMNYHSKIQAFVEQIKN